MESPKTIKDSYSINDLKFSQQMAGVMGIDKDQLNESQSYRLLQGVAAYFGGG